MVPEELGLEGATGLPLLWCLECAPVTLVLQSLGREDQLTPTPTEDVLLPPGWALEQKGLLSGEHRQ